MIFKFGWLLKSLSFILDESEEIDAAAPVLYLTDNLFLTILSLPFFVKIYASTSGSLAATGKLNPI